MSHPGIKTTEIVRVVITMKQEDQTVTGNAHPIIIILTEEVTEIIVYRVITKRSMYRIETVKAEAGAFHATKTEVEIKVTEVVRCPLRHPLHHHHRQIGTDDPNRILGPVPYHPKIPRLKNNAAGILMKKEFVPWQSIVLMIMVKL